LYTVVVNPRLRQSPCTDAALSLSGLPMRALKTILRPVVPAALMLLLALPVAAAELVMIDREGCGYCIAWKKEIGPAYPNTDLGQFAPLRIVNIREGAPEGVTFARPVLFTPTFILIEDGAELARIEGYPGEDFFWGLLEKMLKETTDFVGSS
jgi:hypothetical protein